MKITFLFELVAFLGLLSPMVFGKMSVQNNAVNENILTQEDLGELHSDNITFQLPEKVDAPLSSEDQKTLNEVITLAGQMTGHKYPRNGTIDHVEYIQQLIKSLSNETILEVGASATISPATSSPAISPTFSKSDKAPKESVISQLSKMIKPMKTCDPSTSYVVLTSTIVSTRFVPFTSYESFVLKNAITSTARVQEIKKSTVNHVEMVWVNVEPRVSTVEEYLAHTLVSPMTFYFDKVNYITKTERPNFTHTIYFDEFVSTITSLSETFVTITKVKTKTTSIFVTKTLTTSDVFVYPTTIYSHIPLTSTVTEVKKFPLTIRETKLELHGKTQLKTVFETRTVRECGKDKFLKKLYNKLF